MSVTAGSTNPGASSTHSGTTNPSRVFGSRRRKRNRYPFEKTWGPSETRKTDLNPIPFSPMYPAAFVLLDRPVSHGARTLNSRNPASLFRTSRRPGPRTKRRSATPVLWGRFGPAGPPPEQPWG